VELIGKSAPGVISFRPVQGQKKPDEPSSLPAHLVLDDVLFEDPSGDSVLDAEESGTLTLQVRNDGLGTGKVSVRLTPLSDVEHLSFQRHTEVGLLPVEEAQTIRVPIQADIDVADGPREVRVEIVEEYSRTTVPFTFRFNSHSLVKPKFRVIVRSYDDGRFFKGNVPDGRIQAGEMVKVVANVQNMGGEAEAVAVAVETKGEEGISYARDLQGSSENRFVLGKLAPGKNRDITFYFFTTSVFADPKVGITLRVSEARGRFGVEEELVFDIGQSVKTEDVLVVEPGQKRGGALAPVVDSGLFPEGSQTRLEHGLAIIFGIEDYRYTFEAAYKHRDAATFFQYCRDVLGIPEERIQLRMDSDATKAEFDYVFEPRDTPNQGWLKKRLRDPQEAAQTDLIVYLAGHGFPDFSTRSPYLIPYDVRPEQATNGVSLEKLYQTLSEFKTRSVTVFVESCFSGASGYDRSGAEQLLVLNTNPVIPVIEQPIIGPNMVLFTATSGDKPSSNRDDLRHGIFTYSVLKGLGGAADGNGDKAITVEELFRYIKREVPKKALESPLDREQVPELLPSVDRLGERAHRVLVQY